MNGDPFESELSRQIWESHYRLDLSNRPSIFPPIEQVPQGTSRVLAKGCFLSGGVTPAATAPIEPHITASWRRVARALAADEPHEKRAWESRFYRILAGFRFLPGGRIFAGAGGGRDLTLFNCFVMGPMVDSMDAIFESLKEGALTMQAGGGVGYDFSPLRPRGTVAWRLGGRASGPVSFMHIWDRMCATLLSTSSRRGAMMATLRCDHPDILDFVDAKRDPLALRNFNLSVLVSDAFLAAITADQPWPLVFPLASLGGAARWAGGGVIQRRLPGQPQPQSCAILAEVPARALWDRIMAAAYDTGEPGVLFIDRINAQNNLSYRECLSATNPCGELPLPPYGACNLGSLNLVRFVEEPFTPVARLDLEGLAAVTATAVRLLDDAIDVSPLPLPAQGEQARGSRRLGLGITGLADALILLGLHYASPAARTLAATAMRTIRDAAYRASVALARERGPFPYFETEPYLASPFVSALPADIRAGIRADGIRNSHLLAIAPAGTISLLANGVSSGLEPLFDFEYRRQLRDRSGESRWYPLTAYALRHWRRLRGNVPLPSAFVRARDLAPADHLAMQAALQPFVDNAIAKTINVPADMAFEEFKDLYLQANRQGLKGCTLFRPNPARGSVLAALEEEKTGKEAEKARNGCCDRGVPDGRAGPIG
ncbi:MAG: adenosylcobalamin-dependent ribonucleoside-diphosphate reductase [Chromatiaceae bacterium]|nr:adenosylcobalamin-dependent ribonucleoside-diphosphate reductase [Candidatus Thioaporhodococcus sediminis]